MSKIFTDKFFMYSEDDIICIGSGTFNKESYKEGSQIAINIDYLEKALSILKPIVGKGGTLNIWCKEGLPLLIGEVYHKKKNGFYFVGVAIAGIVDR